MRIIIYQMVILYLIILVMSIQDCYVNDVINFVDNAIFTQNIK